MHNEEESWNRKDFAVDVKKAYRLFRIILTDSQTPLLSFDGNRI